MRPERTCLDCGAPAVKWQKSDYCAGCRPKRCAHCREPLDPGRVGRCTHCRECRRDQDRRNAANPKRTCSQCRAPLIGRKQSTCPPCNAAIQQRYTESLAGNPERPCIECRQPVGEHRTTPRCKACHSAYRERMRQRPNRQCSLCGDRLTPKQDSLCHPCQRLYQNWWADWKRGNPEARMLGHKRTNRRYGEANP